MGKALMCCSLLHNMLRHSAARANQWTIFTLVCGMQERGLKYGVEHSGHCKLVDLAVPQECDGTPSPMQPTCPHVYVQQLQVTLHVLHDSLSKCMETLHNDSAA